MLLREVTNRSKILIFEEPCAVGITNTSYKQAACRRESYLMTTNIKRKGTTDTDRFPKHAVLTVIISRGSHRRKSKATVSREDIAASAMRRRLCVVAIQKQ